MPLTLTELVEAVAKYAGKPDAHSKAAYARDLALLRGRAKEVDAAPAASPPAGTTPPTPDAVTDPEIIWRKFLDAEDAVLIAAGKPAGRDGAERGSVTRDEAIAIVNGLGIPNALEILAERGYSFGPEPGPGTIA